MWFWSEWNLSLYRERNQQFVATFTLPWKDRGRPILKGKSQGETLTCNPKGFHWLFWKSVAFSQPLFNHLWKSLELQHLRLPPSFLQRQCLRFEILQYRYMRSIFTTKTIFVFFKLLGYLWQKIFCRFMVTIENPIVVSLCSFQHINKNFFCRWKRKRHINKSSALIFIFFNFMLKPNIIIQNATPMINC